MWEVLYAFGRGLVKFVIALFIGLGVGLVTLGGLAVSSPGAWDFRQAPPLGPLLLGIGSGLLTAGGVLFILIFIPWPRRRPGPEGLHRPGRPHDSREDLSAGAFSGRPTEG